MRLQAASYAADISPANSFRSRWTEFRHGRDACDATRIGRSLRFHRASDDAVSYVDSYSRRAHIALPADRPLPWLWLVELAVLVTPWSKRRTGLSDQQRDQARAVLERLPRVPAGTTAVWIVDGVHTAFSPPAAWIRRKLTDLHAVNVPARETAPPKTRRRQVDPFKIRHEETLASVARITERFGNLLAS
jgi:hypothetical protein